MASDLQQPENGLVEERVCGLVAYGLSLAVKEHEMAVDYSAYFEGKFCGQKDTDNVVPRALLKNPHRKVVEGKARMDCLTEEELAYRLVRSSMKPQPACRGAVGKLD